MKLRLSEQQDDEDRPTCLTLDFFSSLMATESKRSGVFQILSFTRKRQRVFSTKLNDGFFMLKVMFVNEAADQLESGLIKENYVLSGNIRNHGQGVIVVKEAVKFWQHRKEIGHSIAWRHKKENVNYKGSNLVTMTTQKMKNLHGNATQIMNDYGMQTSSRKKSARKSSKKRQSSKKHQQSFEKRINDEMNNKNFTEQSLTKSMIIDKTAEEETQSVTPKVEVDKKVSTPKHAKKEEKFKTILQLLASDSWSDSEQEVLILPKKKSQKKFSTNKKKIEQRKKDLQFIFNCLSDSQQENQISLQSRTAIVPIEADQQNLHQAEDDDIDILEWIQQKKKSKSLRTYSQKEETYTKGKIECEKVSKNTSINSFQDSKQTQIDKLKISVQNLYNGYVKKSASWHCEALIKCLHTENQSTFAVICDVAHQYLIFASFLHANTLPFELEQGRMYKFGNGTIRQSLNQRLNHSNFDIEFDCRSFIIQEKDLSKIQDPIQPSKNYTSIEKIHQIQQGLILNCFGILKDFKSFKGKTGNTLHFQIVDPISRWSINYVQFQSRINPESIKSLINSSITIFGAMTSSYKNKPNLVRKNNTIVRHGWLPLSKEAREVADWLSQSNSVAHLQTELTGYAQVNDLRDVQDEIGDNFFLRNVEIIEFKDKYTYRACKTCMKKVEENRCRNCGLRKQGEIEDRLFLRGEIGDLSATMSAIWSNSLAEMLMRDGFATMKQEWLLRPISVWIDRSSSNTITVVKMKMLRQEQSLASLLATVNRNILSN